MHVTVMRAIEAGLRFLLSAQAADGHWSDWLLPPGESRMWTTAYVGYRLCSLPSVTDDALDRALRRAEEWLRAAEFSRGGWGFSESTGPDADSTSLAILFLRARESRVPQRSVRCLYAHQLCDGGLATYTPEFSYGSWVDSHPEVTAAAVHAMVSIANTDQGRVGRAVDYLRNHRRADGLWDSFWWTTCLYATEQSLSALCRAGEFVEPEVVQNSLLAFDVPTSFESALRLLALHHAGCATSEAVARTLSAAQLQDGSWPGDAQLRLPPRDCAEPWNRSGSAPLFVDCRRIFTTATVLAALGALDVSPSDANTLTIPT